MKKISILILFFKINSTVCYFWKPEHPLILNKNENGVFFPTYMEPVEPDADFYRFTYVEPQDETTSTYTFCTIEGRYKQSTDFSSPSKIPEGILLRGNNPDRNCLRVDFTRELKLDPIGNAIRCDGGEYVIGISPFWKYEIYYKVLIDNTEYIQNLYNYCYDFTNTMSTLYAYYELKNPRLLENEYLLNERNFEFNLRSSTSGYQPHLETDVLRYYSQQNDYKPYEVAVSEFIPFAHWRKSFYQWHNIAPLHKDLHQPWATFINNVRSILAKKTEPIKVFSGIHGIKKSNKSILYLPGSKITIPLLWWIILYNENKSKGVALIMHNEIFDNQNKKPKSWCFEKKKYCEEAGLNNVVPQDEDGPDMMIYCCPVRTLTKLLQLPNVITIPSEGLLKFEE